MRLTSFTPTLNTGVASEVWSGAGEGGTVCCPAAGCAGCCAAGVCGACCVGGVATGSAGCCACRHPKGNAATRTRPISFLFMSSSFYQLRPSKPCSVNGTLDGSRVGCLQDGSETPPILE